MAYLEIRREQELVRCQQIEDVLTEKGITLRIGQENIVLRLGESKQVGPYKVTILTKPPSDHEDILVISLWMHNLRISPAMR
jgi:hypothetical protein